MLTDKQKLRINLKAIEYLDLGEDAFELTGTNQACYYHDGTHSDFDLFNSPKDCMRLVKAIGIRFHIGIQPVKLVCNVTKWSYNVNPTNGGHIYDTYEEAVAGALEEVTNEQHN